MTRHAAWFRLLLFPAILAATALPPQAVSAAHQPAPAIGRVTVSGGTWVDVGPMSGKHADAHVVRLPSGDVLVIGGFGAPDCCCVRRVDLFNPSTNQWERRSSLPRRRCSPVVRLADGRVLVAGGEGINRTTYNIQGLRTAQIYDPRTDEWSATTPMKVRGAEAGVRLANGNVLMVARTRSGGWAEIFNPTTQTWRAAPRPVSPHSQLVRLHGGNVLALGWLYNRPKVCVERFLVRKHRWEPAGDRRSLCANRGATWVMRDGRVLFQTGHRDVFVYNPAGNAWRRFASVPIPREPRPLWIEGFVGVAGQPMAIATRTGCRPDRGRTVGYRWQPREHRWAQWTTLHDGNASADVAKLRDGSVLVSGGVQWPGPCGTVGATHVPSRFAYRYYP